MSAPGLSLIVDQQGNPLSGTFGSTLPTTNIAGTSTGASAGMCIGGLNQNKYLTPVSIDAYGALTIRPGVCPTFTCTSLSTVATGTGAGKSMLSIFNGSATNYARMVNLYAQCPPQVNTTGGLLGIGSGTSYVQIVFALYRITGHSGGTLLTKVASDPGDDSTLDANITVRTGATVTGQASAPSFAWDAAYNAVFPIGPRPDLCVKVLTLPPGYGVTVNNANALGTSVNFVMTLTCSQNVA